MLADTVNLTVQECRFLLAWVSRRTCSPFSFRESILRSADVNCVAADNNEMVASANLGITI